MSFELVYPERRIVSVEWVLSRGFDAKVNAAVDEHVAAHGVFPDDESGAYEAFVAGIAAPDVEESIELLSDLGLATFARFSEADQLDGGARFEADQNWDLDY